MAAADSHRLLCEVCARIYRLSNSNHVYKEVADLDHIRQGAVLLQHCVHCASMKETPVTLASA
jgi:hypothetical protein